MKTAVASLASAALLGLVVCTSARAENPLGAYVGAGIGKANSQYGFFNDGLPGADNFNGNQFGWNAVIGIRPISLVGAELEYLDFGNARQGPSSIMVYPSGGGSQSEDFYGATGHARAAAGFAVGYLPLPLPWVDVFGKLGVAHLWTPYSLSGYVPLLGPVAISESNSSTRLAYGGGAQFRLGAFAVRAEYERISYPTGDPNLLSLGLTWTF